MMLNESPPAALFGYSKEQKYTKDTRILTVLKLQIGNGQHTPITCSTKMKGTQ
jgi:hypothetical protein